MNSEPAPYKNRPDAESWRMVTKEDRTAFAVIFYRYSGLLFKFGLTLVGDEELVKDAIQDFFIYMWDHRENIVEIRHFRTYLLTAFRRFVLRAAARRERSFGSLENIEQLSANPRHLSNKFDVHDDKSEWDRIMSEEINRLPKRLKEVVFLKFYQGLTYEEITAVTSLNYQVVRNTVHRAVKQLRSRMLERSGRK